MYQHYLGVDLHRRRSYVVLMDNQGKLIDQRRLPNDAMPDYVAQLPKSTFAVLEATGNWSYMYDVLDEGTDKVILAHPKRVKAIAAARIKTDKIDANILARMALADLLRVVQAYHETAVRHGLFFFALFSEFNRHSELIGSMDEPLSIFQKIGELVARYQIEGILKQGPPLHAVATLLAPLMYISSIRSAKLDNRIPPLDLSEHVTSFLEGHHIEK